MDLITIERQKYETLWRDVPDYRLKSPGMENLQRFIDVLRPSVGDTLLDIGCGEGVAGLEFMDKHSLIVNWIDITDAGLLGEVPRRSFVKASLWAPWHIFFKHGFDYGFCCDVMEHIPPEYTMLVLDRILSACRKTWFQIAFLPDGHGEIIGQTLHLTVKPFNWWLDHLRSLGRVTEARDICGRGVFVVERHGGRIE